MSGDSHEGKYAASTEGGGTLLVENHECSVAGIGTWIVANDGNHGSFVNNTKNVSSISGTHAMCIATFVELWWYAPYCIYASGWVHGRQAIKSEATRKGS